MLVYCGAKFETTIILWNMRIGILRKAGYGVKDLNRNLKPILFIIVRIVLTVIWSGSI